MELRYYSLVDGERVLHPSHESLRPSGWIGLLFGIVGTIFMLANITYLLRKRLARITWLGSLRSWIAFHIFTGLVGPGLILLHGAFSLNSPLATLAFLAMMVVVCTGLMGRFIYAHVPRSIEGRELELSEVSRNLTRTLTEMRALGVGESLIAATTDRDIARAEKGRFFPALANIFLEGQRIRLEYRKLRHQVLSNSSLRLQARKILPLAKKLCRERRWYSRYHQLRHLMGVWRFLHRWLAIVMLIMVLFHILLALQFGDLWILEGFH